MLVLTIREGKRIRVQLPSGEVGWITLMPRDGYFRGVRLGLEFPEDVKLHREEILEEKDRYGATESVRGV